MHGISVPEWGRKRVSSRFTYKKKKILTPKRDRHLWSSRDDQMLAASAPAKKSRLSENMLVSASGKKKKKTKRQKENTNALQARKAATANATKTPTKTEKTRVAKRLTTKPRSPKVPPRAPRKKKKPPQLTKVVRLKAQRDGERGHQNHQNPQVSHRQKLESKLQSLTSALISTVAHHRKRMLELGQAATEHIATIQAETDGVAAQLSADLARFRPVVLLAHAINHDNQVNVDVCCNDPWL